MKFKELLQAARVALHDTAGSKDEHHLLRTSVATLYFNEAINEACRRARLLVDRSTPEICRIPVVAGNPVVPTDPRIIKIRRAKLTGSLMPLHRKYVQDMDNNNPGWEDQTGNTDSYVADYETNKIFLHRIPGVDAELQLVVVRLPLKPLTGNEDEEPEIQPQYHAALVHYVVAEMRNIEDTELYDPRKADKAMAEFDKEFGPKRSAQCEVYEASQPYPENE